MVYIDARNIATNRPIKKLDYKNLEPFTIIKQYSPRAYRLDLSKEIRMHNIFNTLLLRPTAKDLLSGQATKELSKSKVIVIDGIK